MLKAGILYSLGSFGVVTFSFYTDKKKRQFWLLIIMFFITTGNVLLVTSVYGSYLHHYTSPTQFAILFHIWTWFLDTKTYYINTDLYKAELKIPRFYKPYHETGRQYIYDILRGETIRSAFTPITKQRLLVEFWFFLISNLFVIYEITIPDLMPHDVSSTLNIVFVLFSCFYVYALE